MIIFATYLLGGMMIGSVSGLAYLRHINPKGFDMTYGYFTSGMV